MDAADRRTTVTQLAEDLAWLERHAASDPARGVEASRLRLAGALVRNVFGPFLDHGATRPVHVAVVGGAGTGKSTVVNLIAGSVVAEANPQAGFTRHPTAFVPGSASTVWPLTAGFLGNLQRIDTPTTADLDQDVYQVRRAPTADGAAFGPLGDIVLWDCPDMTTWAAGGYVARLLETAALADVIVFVASDERYNDAVPTQFLYSLLEAGKPVVCCLTKMREADAIPLVNHFKEEVLARAPGKGPDTPVVAVPFLPLDQRTNPLSATARVPLLNHLVRLTVGTAPRERTVRAGLTYLDDGMVSLLSVARAELVALQQWVNLVREGRDGFVDRYAREFLIGEPFKRFDQAKTQLLDRLELPGTGAFVAGSLWVLRSPYRGVRGLLSKAMRRPAAAPLSEDRILDEGYRAWIDRLRAESLQRAESGGLWKHLSNGFRGGFADDARHLFEENRRSFRSNVSDEIEARCKTLLTALDDKPRRLAALRIGKLGLDATAIGTGIYAGGLSWPSLITVPVFVSLTHQGVESLTGQVVERQREESRRQKERLIRDTLAVPTADWLERWPASGGSTFERLQQTLTRVPLLTQQLKTALAERLPTEVAA